METELKKIGNYFVNKVINKDYEFVKADKHTANILIDGRYKFHLWIANGYKSFNFWFPLPEDDMILGSYLSIPLDHKEAGFNYVNELADNYKKTVLKKQLEEQLKNL